MESPSPKSSTETKLALCFADEPDRCLTAIGLGYIHFNLGNGFMQFTDEAEVAAFRERWYAHFASKLIQNLIVSRRTVSKSKGE